VLLSLGQGKRPPDEADRAVVGEVAWPVGAAVRPGRLGIAAQVHAAQQDVAARGIDEPIAEDAKR